MPAINESKILILATSGFEQSELVAPRQKLSSAGATVHLATPDGSDIRGWDEDHWGDQAHADLSIDQVNFEDYDALILPGGQINPDVLRTIPRAVEIVRQFVESGRIVAAICHGPWMLIEADVVKDREMTSYHSIKTDMINAGANWVDRDVATSNGIITSRNPGDLDVFVDKIIEEVQEGRHPRQAA